MTLPTSGSIAFSQINTEMGRSATAQIDLGWINSNVKASYRPGTPNLNSVRGYAWYQRNQDGNCNNGNCGNCNCNCGTTNCVNCKITGTVNCANCDTQNWLQPNCNCACTYNCTKQVFSYTPTTNCGNCGGY